MAYPPETPPTTRTDSTLSAVNHARDHNIAAAALRDLIAELGANPAGLYASLTERLLGISAAQDAEAIREFLEHAATASAAATAAGASATSASASAELAAAIAVGDVDAALATLVNNDATAGGLALRQLVEDVAQVANVIRAGAVGDGIADDSDAVEAILNTPNAVLPPGTFRVTRTLTVNADPVLTYVPGFRLRGAGMDRTTILIDHADTDPGIRFITNTARKYVRGIELEGFTLRPKTKTAGQAGVEAVGILFAELNRVRIDGFGGDGFKVPLRTDLDVNSDAYQLGYTVFRNTIISNCDGWGLNAPGGLAFAVTLLEQSQIVNNGLGGAWIACHTFKTLRSVFGNNGALSAGAGGGLVLDRVQAVPTLFVDDGTEWDGNHNYHLWLKSVASAHINGRFLAKEGFIAGALAPAVSIKLGDAGKTVRSVLLDAPHVRTDVANNYPHTFIEVVGADTSAVELREPSYGTVTSALTKIAGTGLGNGVVTIEQGRRSYTRLTAPTATLLARKNADQPVPASTVTRVTWPSEESDLAGMFDPATGVLTTPHAGFLRFEGFLYTTTGLAVGDEVTLYLRLNGNAAKILTVYGNGQPRQSIPFSFTAAVGAAGVTADLAIHTSKAGGLTLVGDTQRTQLMAYLR